MVNIFYFDHLEADNTAQNLKSKHDFCKIALYLKIVAESIHDIGEDLKAKTGGVIEEQKNNAED